MKYLSVFFPSRLQRSFKLRACRAFPKEFGGYLVGTALENGYTITDIYYPPDLLDFADSEGIDVPEHWNKDAQAYAETAGAQLLGGIHTHPYSNRVCSVVIVDPVQSVGDLNSAWEPGHKLHAIMNVYERSDGRKRCSDVHFYGRTPIVECYNEKRRSS